MAAALLAPVMRAAITRTLMIAARRGLAQGFRLGAKQAARRSRRRAPRAATRRTGRRGNFYYSSGGNGGGEVSRETIVRAMQSQAVRRALAAEAEAIAGTANALIASEGLSTITATVESGTRPRGRPYSRVVIEGGAPFEWGTHKTGRRRILGRAGSGRGGSVRVEEGDL